MSDKQTTFIYPAVFSRDPNGRIAVVFPDLGTATDGDTDVDAFASARELLGVTLFGLEEDREPIPSPTPVSEFDLAPDEYAALVDVYMPAVRLSCVNKSVNRTVTLPAWLNALALEKGINFSQLLQAALKKQLNINEGA